MPKKIDWQKIKKDYLICKDSITLKDFAKKHNVKYSTLRSRKNREEWDNVATDDATKQKRKDHNKKLEIKEDIIKLKDADLTDKQQLFCIEYVKCFNATKAYQKVYQCSYNSAMTEGSNHLSNPKIKAEIERLKQGKFNRAMLDENDIFQKYIDIAFSDMTDYIDFGTEEIPIMDNNTGKQGIDEEGNPIFYTRNYIYFKDESVDGSLISEVSQGKDGVKIKLQDKMKALQWLSDRMDLLPSITQVNKEKVEVEIELVKEKTKLLKGTKKDTSLLDALINVVNEDE